MREIGPGNAAEYLRESGRVPADRPIEVRPLAWGVSNLVLRVEVAGHDPIVLKQSRERLRTEMLWVSRLDRIWAETAALRRLGARLPAGAVPEVLWEDRDNYTFAMTCAPDDSVVWKAQLLAGRAEPDVARRAGAILAAMHADAPGPGEDWGPLADTTVFDQLRLDPFYRTVARAHPRLAARLGGLIDEAPRPPVRTFVHADFSPKNILVHSHGVGLTVVDFETAHLGGPDFDLGFFLSHLLLKAFRAPEQGPYLDLIEEFWRSYLGHVGEGPAERRLGGAAAHAAACCLARVDEKSPVDYLDEARRAAVRRSASAFLASGPTTWGRLVEVAAREMGELRPGSYP